MAIAPRKFKTGALVRGKLTLPDESASKALTVSSTGEVTSSVTTDAELAFVSGVTSSIQAQLTAAASAAADAQADIDAHILDTTGAHAASAISNTPSGNLVATDVQSALNELQTELDAVADVSADVADLVTLSGVAANSTNLGTFTGTIIDDNQTVKAALQDLESFIGALPDPMEYKGLWDASTNTPALTDGTGNNGDVYQVSVAGTQFTPSISFEVGDKAVYNGATAKYEKWDMTDSVISVNGQSGIVVLDSDDIAEGSVNLYFTDGRAQTAAVVDSTAGAETVQAASVAAMKAYVTAAVGAAGSPGDLGELTFSLANNQVAAADVTGLAFSNAVVRSFVAQVSVAISATSDLYEEFELHGIQRGADWSMSVESTGDESGIAFNISNLGQITYTSSNVSGFTAGSLHARARVTNV